jgi:hypothetical protein
MLIILLVSVGVNDISGFPKCGSQIFINGSAFEVGFFE